MFFGLTGMPIRNSVFATIVLAEAEPEPLTVANLMTKSLIPLMASLSSSFPWMPAVDSAVRALTLACPDVARARRCRRSPSLRLAEIGVVVAQAGR